MVDDHQRLFGGPESHYGLTEPPFSLAPDPKFVFESRSYSDALEQLTSAIRRREPLTVITGEIGSGKTMLCRALLQRLEPRTFVSVIGNPLLGVNDLLKQMLGDFGVLSRDRGRVAEARTDELVETLLRFLASIVPLRAHAVVMIDEAQHLQRDVLEQLGLLSRVETEDRRRLQVILVGQPELDDVLAQPELGRLWQRATVHRLLTLDRTEVEPYIERRLDVASGGPATGAAGASRLTGNTGGGGLASPARVRFTSPAVRVVAALSRLVPRTINQLCEAALQVADRRGKRTIGAVTVVMAARQLGMQIPLSRRARLVGYSGLAAAIVLIAVGGWFAASGTLIDSLPAPANVPPNMVRSPADAATTSGGESPSADVGSPSPNETVGPPIRSANTAGTSEAAQKGASPLVSLDAPTGPVAAAPGGNRQEAIVLERAKVLARRPDVKGLERLRTELLKEGGRIDDPRRDPVLAELDRHLDEARRLQLAIDAQGLRETQSEEYREALRQLIPNLDEASAALAAWSIGTGSRPDSRTTATLASRLQALEPPAELAAVHGRLSSSLDSLTKALAVPNNDDAARQTPRALAAIAEARGAFQRFLRLPGAADQPRR